MYLKTSTKIIVSAIVLFTSTFLACESSINENAIDNQNQSVQSEKPDIAPGLEKNNNQSSQDQKIQGQRKGKRTRMY